MKCELVMSDMLAVHDAEHPQKMLHLDASKFYCRLFETSQLQSRDYLEEVMRWSNGEVENYDYLAAELMHFTRARRKMYGIKR